MGGRQPVGVVLSGASTQLAVCQVYEHAEKGKLREGMFLQIESQGKRRILGRVTSIMPQNEFYLPGDAWTEARRKQWQVPANLARQYELFELELLGELPGLKEITVPPYAGDNVFEIDVSKAPEEIFGVKNPSPGVIWYGTLLGYSGAPIPLTVEGIPMHCAVFGVTGSGKSYDVGALIEKLVRIYSDENIQLSIPMLIIDANADYIDYFKHCQERGNLGACPTVLRFVFPNSPELKTYPKNTRPIAINLNNLTLRDLAELIVQYYSGGEKNELQVAGIETLIQTMEARGDIAHENYQQIFLDDDIFRMALHRLEELRKSDAIHSATAAAIYRGLNKFREIENRFSLLSETPRIEGDFIDNLTEKRFIAILDFSADAAPGVPLSLRQLVISYLSSILFQKFTEYKVRREERYMLFIIEEAQNYCPNLSVYNVGYSLAKEKLSLIATQGRKFGLSLCLISQRPSFIDPIVLSMCNTFFIHRISPEDASFVKKVCGGLPKDLERRLTTLERGEVIVTGQMSLLPFPVVIRVPEREVPHTYGKTDVLSALRRLA
ncbi:MAG: ATP-binding protein [Candidatus Aenigmatarchaeota archaeon]